MTSNVMIGMVCTELARFSEPYNSLIAMDKPEGTPIVQNYHSSVAFGMNEIGRYFLKSEHEYLFFVNDDMIYPKYALTKLLEHQKDITCGVYLRRGFPFEPVIYDFIDERGMVRPHYFKDGECGLIQIRACGSGVTLIHRRVLETMKQPWWRLGTIQPDLISEDLTFSRESGEAGFEIWCDLDVRCGHIILAPVFPHYDSGQWSTLLMQGPKMAIGLEKASAMTAAQVKIGTDGIR